jgi:predicted transcriptional regulator
MIEATKLTEKSAEVFEYVKNAGGKVSVPELAQALGRSERSIGANLTDLKKKGFGEREKVEVEGEEKAVTYFVLNDEGKAWVPTPDAE